MVPFSLIQFTVPGQEKNPRPITWGEQILICVWASEKWKFGGPVGKLNKPQ